MSNKSSKLYMSDQTETTEQDADMGDVQVLVAGEQERVVDYEKSGNQPSNYYKK